MGLSVAEIEGDAVFFYRIGEKPTFETLYQQTVKMYNAFHTLLKEYERDRICDCGACSMVNNLQLKFVSHYGNVVKRTIHKYLQLMGSDVTTVHKLLKNNVKENEYLLWSRNSLSDKTNVNQNVEYFREKCMNYDGVGDVHCNYILLESLFENVPEPTPRKTIELIENPLRASNMINVNINEAYILLTDLDQKSTWMQGLKRVKYENERIHRIGTTHDCVLPLNTLNFETIENKSLNNQMVYTEHTHSSFMFPAFYQRFVLTKVDENKTAFKLEIHYKGFFLKEWLLKFMMKPLILLSIKKFKTIAENKIEKTKES